MGALKLLLWPPGALTFCSTEKRKSPFLAGFQEMADVVTESRWFCQVRVYPAPCLRAVAQNEAYLVASHLPKGVQDSFEKSGSLDLSHA